MKTITLEDVCAEIDGLGIPKENADGHSVKELVAMWGKHEDAVRALIRRGLDAGVIKVGRKTAMDIAGRCTSVPVYTFIIDKKRTR